MQEKSRLTEGLGALLIVLGLALVVFVFYVSYQSFKTYEIEVASGGNLLEALAFNSGVLIELLVKVAFLALSLAAGSVIMSRGADLLRRCPKE